MGLQRLWTSRLGFTGCNFFLESAFRRFAKGSVTSKMHTPLCIPLLSIPNVWRNRVLCARPWVFVSHLILLVRARTLDQTELRLNFGHPLASFMNSILRVWISYPCFIDEEMEAQRSYSTAPGHTLRKWDGGRMPTGVCLTPKCMLSSQFSSWRRDRDIWGMQLGAASSPCRREKLESHQSAPLLCHTQGQVWTLFISS